MRKAMSIGLTCLYLLAAATAGAQHAPSQRGTSDHWIDELYWWMESYGLTQS